MVVVSSGPTSVIPGAVVKELTIGGHVHKTGQVKIGDHIIGINGASLIGMTFSDICLLIKGVTKGCKIQLEVVSGKDNIVSNIQQTPNPAQKLIHKSINVFLNQNSHMSVKIKKKTGEALGMRIRETRKDAVIPSIFISALLPGSVVRRSGKIQIGDQILSVNGKSLVGLDFQTNTDIIRCCAKAKELDLELVRTKKLTSHQLCSTLHGIQLSDGCVFNLDPLGEAIKVGIKPGMHIVEIECEPYFGKSDDEVFTRLKEQGHKNVLCMSPIE